MPIPLWYINLAVNNHNSNAYQDMLNDMRKVKNGVFSCTMKLNDGLICDYVSIENAQYVEPSTTKAHKVP